MGGTGPDEYDCYHLCREMAKRVGIDMPVYGSPETPGLIHNLIAEDAPKLFEEIEEPEPYCLVLFCVKYPYVSHIGFVLEDCKKFIHIFRKSRVTVEKLNDIAWNHRIRGYLRWKKQL